MVYGIIFSRIGSDSKWPHNLRQQLKRKPEDRMEDLDVNTLIRGMFMIVTQQAAVHLGNDYLENLLSTKNLSQRTMEQLFDVTRKLV